MLKIYYNEESNADHVVHLTLSGDFCKVECSSAVDGRAGSDVIENLRPYSSYALTESNGTVKIFRQPMQSDYRFLDLNRLGVSIRVDFAILTQLYGNHTILSVDTGILADSERDIVVRLFSGRKENFTIESDQEYELLPFSTSDLILGDHPRMKLWDSYSLSAGGRELMANRKGYLIDGDPEEPFVPEEGKEYIDFTIQKYKGDFSTKEKLTRDIGDEEVFVDSSAGLVNNRRIKLDHGTGSFRLYPFGVEGPVKIKLGRKWYEVWNDYFVFIGKGEKNG